MTQSEIGRLLRNNGIGICVLLESRMAKSFIAAIASCLGLLMTAAFGWTLELQPNGNYCREINANSSGLEIVLAAGEYRGACRIRRGGKPGSPLIIRSVDLRSKPEIKYDGQNGSVFAIDANYVTIRGLRFGPTEGEVDAIRIFSGNYVTIEECMFDHIGGIAVVGNHASITGTVVRRNIIAESRSTAIYLGCHDGTFCIAMGSVLENNYIKGVTAQSEQIGYGIQLKLNSTGIIRDNVIVNTKGPGIMVYGSRDAAEFTMIERNFVEGSQDSSGIVLGGGPAIVRNNIIAWNNDGGIGLEDYGNRGLLRNLAVTYNTIYKNGGGGIIARFAQSADGEVFGNAVVSRSGTPGIFSERHGFVVFGNEDCSEQNCFVDPDQRDFTPIKTSGLVRHAETHRNTAVPADDYFRRLRGTPPVIGAIESGGSKVVLGLKSVTIPK